MRETPLFKHADDGKAAVIMGMVKGPHLFMVGNIPFLHLTGGAKQVLEMGLAKKLIWSLLVAPLFAHEDRALWIDANVRLVLGPGPSKSTHFLKMYSADGDIKLYLVTMSTYNFPDGRVGCMHRYIVHI
jgi:hypothetical protein